MSAMLKQTRGPVARLFGAGSPRQPPPAPADSAVPDGFTEITQFAVEDVFIVGYPKSGNTWVQNLLAGAVYGLDLEFAPDALVQDLVPDVHGKKYYKRYNSLVFFKSHALPTADYQRVIYLARDGRDAMVSYWHHLRALARKELDFLELVRTGEGLFPCKWHTHVQQWLANPFKAKLIVVKYEDLKQNALRELQRICEFAGLQRDVAVLQTAAKKASFDSLQTREKRLGWENSQWPKDKPFIRRGAVGSHADEMPPEVQKAFLHEAADALRQLGYAV